MTIKVISFIIFAAREKWLSEKYLYMIFFITTLFGIILLGDNMLRIYL